ncbi:glycosyltransferase 87 family protein [Jatrophihabitans fulvus]
MLIDTRPRRAVATAVIVLAVVAALAVALPTARLGDVGVYRAGGRAVFGGDLYGLRVGGFGFTYPPFAAALFAPLARLTVPAMFAALTAVSALALAVVLRRSVPAGCGSGWATALRIAPWALAQPVVATLQWGQVNLLLAAVVMHDLLVRRSGVLVGLAAAVKLTPAVFVVYLLLCGRTREARTATVTFVAATGAGVLVAPSASWRYWTHDVVAGTGFGGVDHTANQSVRGLAERLLGHGTGVAVWIALAGPVLTAGVLLARRVARAGGEIAAVGVVGLTACLVSPVAWNHHWVWFVPCLAGLPVAARLVPGALVLSPFEFGPVLGHAYAVVAFATFAVVGRRYRCPADVTVLAGPRGEGHHPSMTPTGTG